MLIVLFIGRKTEHCKANILKINVGFDLYQKFSQTSTCIHLKRFAGPENLRHIITYNFSLKQVTHSCVHFNNIYLRIHIRLTL